MARIIAATLFAVAVTGATFAQEEKQPPGGGRGGRGGGQFGQGGRGGFAMFGGAGTGVMQILEMPEVQNDLKLTADEKGNIPLLKEELAEGDKKFGESLQSVDREARIEKMAERRAEVDKQIKEVLGDKYTRFRQIRLQLDGLFASLMSDKEVKDALNFTDDQRTQLFEAMRPPEGGSSFRFTPGERPDPAKLKEMREQGQKRQQEALDKVLNADQKKKWEELIGPKVSYKKPEPQFGQGRGPGGTGSEGRARGGRGRRGEGNNPPPGGETEKKPPSANL
jgi:hypothetical protein